jgi:lipoate-protein ligase B
MTHQDAWELQQRRAQELRDGGAESLILLEHPPTYTLGVRGKDEHLLVSDAHLARRGATVVRSDRGGDITFHGPGQIVGYPIVNLRARGEGPVWYVRTLETALIDTLAHQAIDAERVAGKPGVWCAGRKIASIGVRVSRGVTTHGFALNVNTDLSYFDDIVPCGLPGVRMTSMQRITGRAPDIDDVCEMLEGALARHLGLESAERREEVLVGS